MESARQWYGCESWQCHFFSEYDDIAGVAVKLSFLG